MIRIINLHIFSKIERRAFPYTFNVLYNIVWGMRYENVNVLYYIVWGMRMLMYCIILCEYNIVWGMLMLMYCRYWGMSVIFSRGSDRNLRPNLLRPPGRPGPRRPDLSRWRRPEHCVRPEVWRTPEWSSEPPPVITIKVNLSTTTVYQYLLLTLVTIRIPLLT